MVLKTYLSVTVACLFFLLPRVAYAECEKAQQVTQDVHLTLAAIEHMPHTNDSDTITKKHGLLDGTRKRIDIFRKAVNEENCQAAPSRLVIAKAGHALATWTALSMVDTDLTAYQRATDTNCKTWMLSYAKRVVSGENLRLLTPDQGSIFDSEAQRTFQRVAQRLGVTTNSNSRSSAEADYKSAVRDEQTAKLDADSTACGGLVDLTLVLTPLYGTSPPTLAPLKTIQSASVSYPPVRLIQCHYSPSMDRDGDFSASAGVTFSNVGQSEISAVEFEFTVFDDFGSKVGEPQSEIFRYPVKPGYRAEPLRPLFNPGSLQLNSRYPISPAWDLTWVNKRARSLTCAVTRVLLSDGTTWSGRIERRHSEL